jgi:hypothetical protein
MNTKPKPQDKDLQGEGNYDASRRYRKGAEKHASDAGRVEKEARDAKKSVEGPERKELADAEKKGKSKAASDPKDDKPFGPV